ncbi:FAD-binding oxidoreductase [Halobacillus sp. BBL2006]|uniref:NAD(P)/FAD-dependent oxidoreductase n=1 Tax=Halobacillus sp. BBL2006 TaxID=1543706 RepID=UPI00054320ED|nr:FAD-dependent oxidoreductase [Halobacillus sp. BBL2006]KHE71989.1 oxidoreductase [Halobacillus sp. BBL2006]
MKHIIIGAGILGASTAYHLAKAGEEVVVVDRNDPGQATQAGAGIVCPWLTNRSNAAWYRLVLEGARYYPSLIKDLQADGETDTGYSKVGAINIFDTEEKLNKKMQVAYERKEEAPEMGEITKLSSEQTKELFPPVSHIYGSVHIGGAARVDGKAICTALLRAAKKNGATEIFGSAKLLSNGSEIQGVLVNGRSIIADQVIVTNGAWGQELFEPFGLKTNVSFEKAQIVHLQMPGMNTKDWPVMLPPFNHYMVTFGGGRLVIGATKEKSNDFNTCVTTGSVHQLLDKALRVAPGLSEATYLGTKVGFRPFTPGSLPVIGHLPQFKNVLMANGLGASGLTSGPFVGAELAKMAIGNRSVLHLPDYDVNNAFQ